MNIALIGYGKMGQEIAHLIQSDNKHTIVSISYKKQSDALDLEGIKKADVAIDFTSPEIVLKNIEQIASMGINLVIGTTGWLTKLKEVEKSTEKNKIGLIYGSNFSIGANIYFQLIKEASVQFNRFSELYDVYGYEIHHTGKVDSPSGTAKTLAEIIIKNYPKKKILQENTVKRKIKPEELHFASVRGGLSSIFHEVTFDSLADEVKLIHKAHGRRGYAEGAIMAAEFIKGKKGLYQFDELFSTIAKK